MNEEKLTQQEVVDKFVDIGFKVDERGPEGWAGKEALTQELQDIHFNVKTGKGQDGFDYLNDWGYRYLMGWDKHTGGNWDHQTNKDPTYIAAKKRFTDYERAVINYARLEGCDTYEQDGVRALDLPQVDEVTLQRIYVELKDGIVGFKED